MDFPATIQEARQAIIGFLVNHAAALPAELLGPVTTAAAAVSPADQICDLAETLYANKERAGYHGRNLAAKLGRFGGQEGYKFLRDGRGTLMAWAMMRRNGLEAPDGVTFQTVDDDPEPLAQFAVPVPEPVEEEPAPEPGA